MRIAQLLALIDISPEKAGNLILMPCPSIGPKLFWTVQIVLDGYKLFWLSPIHFGQVQIDFSGLFFIIWTCPKRFGHNQNELDPSKTIGTQPK